MPRGGATHHFIVEVFVDECGIGDSLSFVRAKGIVATTTRHNARGGSCRPLPGLTSKGILSTLTRFPGSVVRTGKGENSCCEVMSSLSLQLEEPPKNEWT